MVAGDHAIIPLNATLHGAVLASLDYGVSALPPHVRFPAIHENWGLLMVQQVFPFDQLLFVSLIAFYLTNIYLILVFKLFHLNMKYLFSYIDKSHYFLKRSYILVFLYFFVAIIQDLLSGSEILPGSLLVPGVGLGIAYLFCVAYSKITTRWTVQSFFSLFLEHATI
nr:hypothetical protein [Candidatus Sigynarchaeota archaeon]